MRCNDLMISDDFSSAFPVLDVVVSSSSTHPSSTYTFVTWHSYWTLHKPAPFSYFPITICMYIYIYVYITMYLYAMKGFPYDHPYFHLPDLSTVVFFSIAGAITIQGLLKLALFFQTFCETNLGVSMKQSQPQMFQVSTVKHFMLIHSRST